MQRDCPRRASMLGHRLNPNSPYFRTAAGLLAAPVSARLMLLETFFRSQFPVRPLQRAVFPLV